MNIEQQYYESLSTAYRLGYERRYAEVSEKERPDMKMHYFKRKEPMARVEMVLGFLRGIISGGLCQSLVDVGSGRGAFLFPLMDEFPELKVTSIDILPHRVELLRCLQDGGMQTLYPILGNICDANVAPDKSADIVTMLEVLEHIPDTESAVRNAVRIARSYIVVSVPSKPDDNPEHIHLFSTDDLRRIFTEAGARQVKFMDVNGHHIMFATL